MRRFVLAAIASLAVVPAFAGDLVWHFYRDDEGSSGVLAVVDEDEIESPEPHYPFLMTCSLDSDWLMFVSDVDARQLGEAIARGDRPTFTFDIATGGGSSAGSEYYPDISFGQTEGVWQYSNVWDLSILDRLVAADAIAVKGTGVDLATPAKAMKVLLAEFRTFCGGLNEAIQDDPDKAPP